MKTALVLGAGGFIGSHMVIRLKSEGFWVRGVDLKFPSFSESQADEFVIGDLTSKESTKIAFQLPEGKFFDEVYQYAADMGGAGFIFTGENDADIMHNSALINLNVLETLRDIAVVSGQNATRVFYSSSACIYPERNQLDANNPNCEESSAYPAAPDSEYGWEKLFSERLYVAFNRNYSIPIAIARFHNIYGPLGTWKGGREKAPAAICRKIALLPESGGTIEVWGDGKQTRSFLFIDECIEATRRLMNSPHNGPVNIGSEEMVSIEELVDIVSEIANKKVDKNFDTSGPIGVRGRNSQNDLIRDLLNWDYSLPLRDGLTKTYDWIHRQIEIEG
jgi:nucleoside-diphosphate-sugar epimerase